MADEKLPEFEVMSQLEEARLRLDCWRAVAETITEARTWDDVMIIAAKLYDFCLQQEDVEEDQSEVDPTTKDDQCERRH